MRRLFLCLFVMVVVSAQALTPPSRQRFYMFGLAMSLAERAVVLTDVQEVEGYLKPNGFLADRPLYALQLNNYVLSKLQLPDMTCTVFFSKNKSKAEKKYQKIQKKYRDDHAGPLLFLGREDFRFQTEEWVDTTPESVVK